MDLPTTHTAATILLIDDNPANLGVLTRLLMAHGFHVLVAQQGESGLQIAQRARPDLILLDVLLPGMDGFATCRRLKADPGTADIPVLFITVRAEAVDKLHGFAAGGVDHIAKPFEEAEVLARVTIHLRLRDLTRQLQEANKSLERRVAERTAELVTANARLLEEIADRKRADEALRFSEEEIQRRNRELALLNRVIAASVTETEPEAILEITCRELALTFDVPQAAAALLNAEKTEAYVVAEYLAAGRPPALRHTIPVIGNPWFQHLLSHKTPLVVDDAQHDPRMAAVRDLVRQRGIVALLIVPLVIEGEVVGSLGLDAIEPRQFSAEQVSLAWSVASQVAGVLARLQLDQARRRLESQYHQAQKMEAIGRLTGGVAHDFNNILTAILGNCGLILDDLDQHHTLRQEVEQIQLAAERGAALTHQLLAFSRQQILQPQVVNVNDSVRNVEKMLRRLIGEDIALVSRLEPRLEPVKADPGQLEQIIMNLAVNARDAMPRGGKLTIETANVLLDEAYVRQHMGVPSGPYVMLAVSDTGVGMAPEVQARVFEPFFTTKAAGQGTGLGLATCYGIVQQHSGHIWVYSELGHGTTVKVYLPRTTAVADARAGAGLPALALGGRETVLLVEDEGAVRALAARVLRQLGYTVLEAGDGVEALGVAAGHAGAVELLLSDVVMPRLGGPALAERLRATYPALKVLFMSGYAEKTIVQHSILAPDTDFLQKPFAPELLARKVREVLGPNRNAIRESH